MNTRKITMGGLFLALGILLPQLFHIIGGSAAGKVFLPMHIPVLLAGLFLGWQVGVIVGIMSPILSFLVTGGAMPPVPMMYFMIFELAAYGLFAGLFYKKFKMNVYVALILSLLGGRIVRGVVIALCIYAFNITLPPYLTIFGAMITGVPGMILQIVIIPGIVYLVDRRLRLETN